MKAYRFPCGNLLLFHGVSAKTLEKRGKRDYHPYSMGLSRRDLFAAGGLAALGSLPALGEAAKTPAKRRVLRIAHITDLHVQPERGAALGMERCLEHAQSHHKPDLILMGGDQVFDCLSGDRARAKTQWDLYNSVLRANVSAPVAHAVGNHDVLGWNAPGHAGADAGYGKAYALDKMGLSRGYRSFDKNGWHLVVLDSVAPCRARGYKARLDDEQFDWLAEDLARAQSKPTLILSHIPILSTSAFFHGDNERTGNWHVPGAWMHIDARRIKDLFAQRPNVVACLSGHIHMLDRLKFQGVRYYGNGAGCGNWWNGAFEGVGPGYAVVDLFSDGTMTNEYVEYGWKTMA